MHPAPPLIRRLFFCFVALLAVAAPMAARAAEIPEWIWIAGEVGDDQVIYARKTVEIDSLGDQKASLVASADNVVELYVNGKLVASDDSWESPVRADVTGDLKEGANVLSARVANAGGSAGLLAELVVGGNVVAVTDASWSVSSEEADGWTAVGFDDSGWDKAVASAKLGEGPRSALTREALDGAGITLTPQATPVEKITMLDGFAVDLVYSVPKAEQGSWVSMAVDGKGRLILSDQYGSLYRLTPGETPAEAVVEEIGVDIGHAQGLLYAFDSLYAVVNDKAHGGRGLYRVTDSNGDDSFDKVELLKKFAEEGGEHGPHAVVLGPDGKSLYVASGNQTAIPEMDASRVPPLWDEDQILPRIYGRGFMREVMAPGGWVAKTDPDGKEWELVSVGFRNQYDIGFNREGELFTFDADMEWDIGTPWYRPTRVCHVVSGSDWGWRNGSAKFKDYYPDTLPPSVDIGPGSPTGVTHGYGAKFPQKYQDAFYIADWSFGKLYAVHLVPDGASYTATFEEFMSAQPLPLTDLEVNPHDGHLYVAIGGRRVQSGVYRVRYEGQDAAPAGEAVEPPTDAAKLRLELESFHGRQTGEAVAAAVPHLGHGDRFVRHAARTALEWQPVAQWKSKVLGLTEPVALTNGMVALARASRDAPDAQSAIVGALGKIDWAGLSESQRLDLIRAYSLAFTRTGEPVGGSRDQVLAAVDGHYPSGNTDLDIELSALLVFLEAPGVAGRTVAALEGAPTQESQIAFAKNLRLVESGWTPELRERYARWFARATSFRGGASFDLFVEDIRKDAIARAGDEAEQNRFAEIASTKPEGADAPILTPEPRPFVKVWTVEDFDPLLASGLEGGRDFENGRKMFSSANCFACHRFDGQGGSVGPDLTGSGGRFSPRDLLESIIEPSKEISDQYGATIFTLTDGSQVYGRIANLSGDGVSVVTNMFAPSDMTTINRSKIASTEPSPVSMMPPALISTLTEDDVLDLLAYLIAAGDPEDPLFQ
ncbi:c-type cytochrome [soil metagenome]